MKKKIVLFGATGNTGVYLADYIKTHLDEDRYELIAVGRKNTDLFERAGIAYKRVDICSAEDFQKLPQENVWAVINMAGILPAYLSEFDPFKYVDTNIGGGIRILEYARKTGADRVLYAQTWAEIAAEWGKTDLLSPSMKKNLIYTGDHAFYAITKSMVVESMQHYYEEFGLKNFVFRLPNIYLYSPEEFYYVDGVKKPIAYRYMIEKVCRGEDLELWGDPNAFKDIVYVKDLCQMMFKALFANVNGGVYHAGTGVKTTLREQLEGMIRVFAPEGKPTPKLIERPEKPGFVSFVMDIENARRDLGYEPQYDYLAYLEDYKKEREERRFDSLWAKH